MPLPISAATNLSSLASAWAIGAAARKPSAATSTKRAAHTSSAPRSTRSRVFVISDAPTQWCCDRLPTAHYVVITARYRLTGATVAKMAIIAIAATQRRADQREPAGFPDLSGPEAARPRHVGISEYCGQ